MKTRTYLFSFVMLAGLGAIILVHGVHHDADDHRLGPATSAAAPAGTADSGRSAQVSSDASYPQVPATGTATNTSARLEIIPNGATANSQQWDALESLVYWGSLEERIDAINMIGKHGTPAQRQAMATIALDAEQDVAVRLAAFDAMDWEARLPDMLKLLRPDDEFPVAALVSLAAERPLSDAARTAIDQRMEALFAEDASFNLRFGVLRFFADTQSEKFDSLATQMMKSMDSMRPEEAADFRALLAQHEVGRCASNGGEDCSATR